MAATRGPAQLIEEGAARFEAGELLEAVRLWREAARVRPDDVRAAAYLAWGEAELHASMVDDHVEAALAPPPGMPQAPLYGPDDNEPTDDGIGFAPGDFPEEPTRARARPQRQTIDGHTLGDEEPTRARSFTGAPTGDEEEPTRSRHTLALGEVPRSQSDWAQAEGAASARRLVHRVEDESTPAGGIVVDEPTRERLTGAFPPTRRPEPSLAPTGPAKDSPEAFLTRARTLHGVRPIDVHELTDDRIATLAAANRADEQAHARVVEMVADFDDQIVEENDLPPAPPVRAPLPRTPPLAPGEETLREESTAPQNAVLEVLPGQNATWVVELEADAGDEETLADDLTSIIARPIQIALAHRDLDAAYAACETALQLDPQMSRAPVAALVEEALVLIVGPLDRVPVVLGMPPDLEPRSAFMLSRLDGTLCVEDILDISGMGRIEALRLLARLAHQGAISGSRKR